MKTQIMSFTSDIHKRSRSGNSLALRVKQFHILILFSSALKEIHAVFGKTPGWCLVWSNFVQLLGCFLPLSCTHQFSRQARQASQQQVNYEQFTNHFPSNTCQFEIRVSMPKKTHKCTKYTMSILTYVSSIQLHDWLAQSIHTHIENIHWIKNLPL